MLLSYPYIRKCAMDCGDYGMGMVANSLELGCDCLGHIKYFDGVVNNAQGEAVVIPKAICLHEEDAGMLWKHTDTQLNHVEVRRNRRLVISQVSTFANYEYGMFWYFYLVSACRQGMLLGSGWHSCCVLERASPTTGGSSLFACIPHWLKRLCRHSQVVKVTFSSGSVATYGMKQAVSRRAAADMHVHVLATCPVGLWSHYPILCPCCCSCMASLAVFAAGWHHPAGDEADRHPVHQCDRPG